MGRLNNDAVRDSLRAMHKRFETSTEDGVANRVFDALGGLDTTSAVDGAAMSRLHLALEAHIEATSDEPCSLSTWIQRSGRTDNDIYKLFLRATEAQDYGSPRHKD